MIMIHVAYHAKPGKRDAFAKRLLEDDVMGATRKEKGNIDYSFFLPIDDPNTVRLVEIWEDKTTLDFHCTQPTFLHIREIKQEYIESSDIVMYDVRKI